MAQLTENPKDILDKIRSTKSPETKLKGVGGPRNLKQIQNIKRSVTQ